MAFMNMRLSNSVGFFLGILGFFLSTLWPIDCVASPLMPNQEVIETVSHHMGLIDHDPCCPQMSTNSQGVCINCIPLISGSQALVHRFDTQKVSFLAFSPVFAGINTTLEPPPPR